MTVIGGYTETTKIRRFVIFVMYYFITTVAFYWARIDETTSGSKLYATPLRGWTEFKCADIHWSYFR